MREGTVVIDGNSYEIMRIILRGGELHIIAHGHSHVHVPARRDIPATVLGSDGQGVCQGWKTPMPELYPGMSVTIDLPIRIVSLEDENV